MSFEPEKEIRFAVVMYGGVSLAVYMNGVAQELLRLVQATAVDANASGSWRVPGRARESEATLDVYREIANKLGARFVVDILSGTSAGGINAVFLAKALAVGGSLDSVKKTWIKEGDVQSLIFDRESLDASGQKLPNPRPLKLQSDGRTESIPGRSETTTNAAQGKGAREPALNGSEKPGQVRTEH